MSTGTDLTVIEEQGRQLMAYQDRLEELGGWPEENKNGVAKGSQANVLMAIEVLGMKCSYDVFTNQYIVGGYLLGAGLIGDLSDKMVRAFRDYCFQNLRFEPGIEATREGLKRACESNVFNSVQDYLNSLKWDGVPRLHTWLTTYVGVEDTPLHREWGRLTLIAACRRAFEPGCKFDHVPAFEGPEGQGKSTVPKVLAGAKDPAELCPLFSDSTILDKSEKEQLELCQGVWIYEISEMAGASNADQKKLKAFVVRQADRAREAYAYFKTAQPRSPIFMATINTDPTTGEIVEYLNYGDRRRWWPMTVGVVHPIDIPALIRDRDQLFAEAMAMGRDDLLWGGTGWMPLVPNPELTEAALAEQTAREKRHVYDDLLEPLFDMILKWEGAGIMSRNTELDGEWRVTPGHVWVTSKLVLKELPPGASTDAGGRAVATAMRKNGWEKHSDGTRRWWRHPR